MIKTIKLSNKLASSKNNGNKSAWNWIVDSKLVFRKNENNNKINRFSISKTDLRDIKK